MRLKSRENVPRLFTPSALDDAFTAQHRLVKPRPALVEPDLFPDLPPLLAPQLAALEETMQPAVVVSRLPAFRVESAMIRNGERTPFKPRDGGSPGLDICQLVEDVFAAVCAVCVGHVGVFLNPAYDMLSRWR